MEVLVASLSRHHIWDGDFPLRFSLPNAVNRSSWGLLAEMGSSLSFPSPAPLTRH